MAGNKEIVKIDMHICKYVYICLNCEWFCTLVHGICTTQNGMVAVVWFYLNVETLLHLAELHFKLT